MRSIDNRIRAMVAATRKGDRADVMRTLAKIGDRWDEPNWTVSTQWTALHEWDRAEPVEVCIRFGYKATDAKPVTASVIRQLPIGTMLDLSRRAVVHRATEEPIHLAEDLESMPPAPEWEKFADTGPQRGRSVTAEQDRVTAQIYRAAWAAGMPVTVAVADHFTISASAATKRIMKARRAGLLDGIGPKR